MVKSQARDLSGPFELAAELNFLFALPAMEASKRQEWRIVAGVEFLGLRKTGGKELLLVAAKKLFK